MRDLAGPAPAPRLRVGVDVVAIDEVRQSLDKYSTRYTKRVFTEREVAAAGTFASPTLAAGLAARFAAKEAMMKVLRPAADPPPWRSIEVVSHDAGWVDISLTGESARLAERIGITDLAVSLSHDAGVGLATVIAYVAEPPNRSEGDRG